MGVSPLSLDASSRNLSLNFINPAIATIPPIENGRRKAKSIARQAP
ncbi:MAG: hypothetical protein Ct9H300mP18_12320 [Candidatus Neomarinimicrobiota bacterium]|nr:MAG: hypothetical protein Ct9H300mP18_12320 [Candidatus Neomarinimicrobiota bacterium]